MKQIEVRIFSIPNNFADKRPDGGAFLLDTVTVNGISDGGKQLANHIELDAGKVVLLPDRLQFCQTLFQGLAFLV